MKTLILTCNTGEGHNSTATAIKFAFDRHNSACELEDTLAFLSRKASDFICNWHVRIYRYIPRAFQSGYKFAEEHPSVFEEQSSIYKLLTAGSDNLASFLLAGDYDTVICTHVFSALIMTEVQKRITTHINTCYVSTDYTCSPSLNESQLDLYFIPSDDLAEEFMANGCIPREKLMGVGLPVRSEFLREPNRADAKLRFGIPEGKKHLLVMCGSMGCGPLEKLAEELFAALPSFVTFTIVCGTNERLQYRLNRKYGGRNGARFLGYVDAISELMDSADLYLTKPGGISVSEAAAKRLPMVFIDAVAGCEDYNMNYFLERGLAETADTPLAIAELCAELLEDDERRGRMSQRLSELYRDDPAEKIYEILSGGLQEA